jgi:hypothetical protein
MHISQVVPVMLFSVRLKLVTAQESLNISIKVKVKNNLFSLGMDAYSYELRI